MSNYRAIATVTAVLRRNLQSAIDVDVPGAKVGTGRPESSQNGTPEPGVNLFLYQVSPNAAWRNAEMPTRRTDGSLQRRPQEALDLHYLLSFHGDEAKLEAQLLLGSVVRTLHSRPVLTRKMIEDTLADPLFGFLAESNLAESVESIKFTPRALSLEDLSKLWSVFFQTPYSLSLAYQGTVVLIESESQPQVALPVRARNVYALPFRQPTIEQILSQEGENEPIADQPIYALSRLILTGRQLRGDLTRVRIDGEELEPDEADDAQVSVTLPGDLRPGVHSVQVVQYAQIGTPPAPHPGFESNVVAFDLNPKITASVSNEQGSGDAPRSADIRVGFDPKIGKSQRVVLMLNEYMPPADRPALAYSFVVPRRKASDPDVNTDESSYVEVHVSGLRPGTYMVSVQVDGARSHLRFSSSLARYDSPRVTIH